MRRQSELLRQWAHRAGYLRDYTPPEDAETSRGAEHEVFMHPQANRVFKRTLPGSFGCIRTAGRMHRTATPYFYLRRLVLTNQVFHSDLLLEYVTPADKTSIVISQPWAYPADPNNPTPDWIEIGEFMQSLEFELVPDTLYEWYRRLDRIRVSDARRDNFIKSANGVIPIDVIVGQET